MVAGSSNWLVWCHIPKYPLLNHYSTLWAILIHPLWTSVVLSKTSPSPPGRPYVIPLPAPAPSAPRHPPGRSRPGASRSLKSRPPALRSSESSSACERPGEQRSDIVWIKWHKMEALMFTHDCTCICIVCIYIYKYVYRYRMYLHIVNMHSILSEIVILFGYFIKLTSDVCLDEAAAAIERHSFSSRPFSSIKGCI